VRAIGQITTAETIRMPVRPKTRSPASVLPCYGRTGPARGEATAAGWAAEVESFPVAVHGVPRPQPPYAAGLDARHSC